MTASSLVKPVPVRGHSMWPVRGPRAGSETADSIVSRTDRPAQSGQTRVIAPGSSAGAGARCSSSPGMRKVMRPASRNNHFPCAHDYKLAEVVLGDLFHVREWESYVVLGQGGGGGGGV